MGWGHDYDSLGEKIVFTFLGAMICSVALLVIVLVVRLTLWVWLG